MKAEIYGGKVEVTAVSYQERKGKEARRAEGKKTMKKRSSQKGRKIC